MADKDSRVGTSYMTAELIGYLADVHAPQDPALKQAFDAPHTHDMPAIQLAPSEGRLLTLLMRMIDAHKVVEIGTLAGYSTICLARGLAEGGHVWTIELDERHARVARENIDAAGLSDRVTVIVGPAQDVLAELDIGGNADAVFIDADKESYPQYGRWAADNLRSGGLLLADNTALFGELLGDDERAQGMRRFHESVAADFESVNIPTPDGLLLGLRS